MDPQVKVAGPRTLLPLAFHANAGALDDACWDLDFDLAPGRPYPLAAAGRAGDALHHGPVAHLATLADKPGTTAGWAGLGDLGLDRSLPAASRLFERDLDWMLDVLAAVAGRGSAASGAAEVKIETGNAPAALPREKGVEEIAEVAIAGGASLTPGLGLILAGKLLLTLDPLPVGTQLVVLRSLLRVAEHLIGLIDQLEALGRFRILVDILVILPRQLAVGRLDLLLARRSGDTQGLVVVLVLRSGHCLRQGCPKVAGGKPDLARRALAGPADDQRAAWTMAYSRQCWTNLSTSS